jgi:hypothetical protein
MQMEYREIAGAGVCLRSRARRFVSSGHFLAHVSYAFMLLGQERFAESDQALADLAQHPVQDNVQLSVIYDRLGVSRALERRFVEALEYFTRAVELDAYNPVAAQHVTMVKAKVRAPTRSQFTASSPPVRVPAVPLRAQNRAPTISARLMQVFERPIRRMTQKKRYNKSAAEPSMVDYFRAVGLPHRAVHVDQTQERVCQR